MLLVLFLLVIIVDVEVVNVLFVQPFNYHCLILRLDSETLCLCWLFHFPLVSLVDKCTGLSIMPFVWSQLGMGRLAVCKK